MPLDKINIKGIDKAQLLAALYNNSKGQGVGLLINDPSEVMSRNDAQLLFDNGWFKFDYLRGRVMKINLKGDTLDPILYDRDNGEGATQAVVDSVKALHTDL